MASYSCELTGDAWKKEPNLQNVCRTSRGEPFLTVRGLMEALILSPQVRISKPCISAQKVERMCHVVILLLYSYMSGSEVNDGRGDCKLI